MLAFYYNLIKLIRVLTKGVREDVAFRVLLVLLVFLLAGGSFFYHEHEDWSWIDALYFCVMTVSTIGYGDLVPTTDLSKGVTILYAFLGVGLFAAVVTKIVTLLVSSKLSKKHSKSIDSKID